MNRKKQRREYSSEFKAKLALEAFKGLEPLSQLSAEFRVHPKVIGSWRRQLVEGAPLIFELGSEAKGRSEEEITAPLYEEIGRLKVELDWLKKKL